MKNLLWFLLLLPAIAHADAAPARARITLIARPAEPVVGSLLALAPDSVVFRDTTEHTYRRADIAKLEISRGVHGHAGKGAWIGFVVGGVIGGVAGANSTVGEDRGLAGLLGAALGAAGGLGVGVLAGSALRGERWKRVAVP